MASPEHLPPVIFGPTRAQRAERVLAGIVCVAVGIGIIVFAGRAGHGETGVIIGGVALAVLGIWFLAARRVRTTIDADGVRTSSMFSRHSCHWSEVADVDLDIDANDGPPMVYTVKILRRAGRPFTLPAPIDSVRRGRHANPDFADQLATIRSYWSASTRPPHSLQP
jgi:hypothetical protein